jgi:hypothetical protein
MLSTPVPTAPSKRLPPAPVSARESPGKVLLAKVVLKERRLVHHLDIISTV